MIYMDFGVLIIPIPIGHRKQTIKTVRMIPTTNPAVILTEVSLPGFSGL